MTDPFTGQQILLALEPVTMAIIGMSIFNGVAGWLGGNKQTNTSLEIERQRIAAAEREAEKQRQFEAEQAEIQRQRWDRERRRDVAMRRPMIESVQTLGPGINRMLGL